MQYIRLLLFYSVIFQSCKFQSPVAYGLSFATDLDDLERRNSLYFAFFFTEFGSFAGRLRHNGRR